MACTKIHICLLVGPWARNLLVNPIVKGIYTMSVQMIQPKILLAFKYGTITVHDEKTFHNVILMVMNIIF